MKRLLVAGAVGLAVFTGVYGLAASLSVSSESLGTGNAAVAACQATALTPSYATIYNSALPGYEVGVVTVNGLTAPCYGKSFKVELVNGSNQSLGEVSGTTPSSGSSFTADFPGASLVVTAANVAGVHVLIAG